MRQYADYCTMELPCATATQSIGGSNIGGMYSYAQALAIRAKRISRTYRNDSRHFP